MKVLNIACGLVLALAVWPALAVAAPLAEGETAATLAQPAANPVRAIVDGRIWDCRGQTCTAQPAAAMEAQSIGRECRRAGASFGAFTAYQTGARTMKAEELADCNLKATKTPLTHQPA